MEYKGYRAVFEFDDDSDAFHGRVIGLRDVISFYADSVEGLKAEFAASVDDYLAFCEERGRDPSRTYSGTFNLRIDPELHRAVHMCAETLGKSINAYVEDTLAKSVSKGQDEADLVRSAA